MTDRTVMIRTEIIIISTLHNAIIQLNN
uniref:Uncharacterized protein n=1 Tax=Arundo donax TaxID=35708 RepID=A0A0A8YE84_ARUDO